MKKVKRVVLGEGPLDWKDGSGWVMLENRHDDFQTGRQIAKEFVGKRVRLVAEILP